MSGVFKFRLCEFFTAGSNAILTEESSLKPEPKLLNRQRTIDN